MNKIELTTEQKWKRVDEIIALVNQRKAAGDDPFVYGIEEYVYTTFSGKGGK